MHRMLKALTITVAAGGYFALSHRTAAQAQAESCAQSDQNVIGWCS